MHIGIVSDSHDPVRPEVLPALAVASAILGFNFLGDALRNQRNPRTRLELRL